VAIAFWFAGAQVQLAQTVPVQRHHQQVAHCKDGDAANVQINSWLLLFTGLCGHLQILIGAVRHDALKQNQRQVALPFVECCDVRVYVEAGTEHLTFLQQTRRRGGPARYP
jgi:hypothetical protein